MHCLMLRSDQWMIDVLEQLTDRRDRQVKVTLKHAQGGPGSVSPAETASYLMLHSGHGVTIRRITVRMQ
jgi:hypothetical protein